MRISDWSSDVCSSDLDDLRHGSMVDVFTHFGTCGQSGYVVRRRTEKESGGAAADRLHSCASAAEVAKPVRGTRWPDGPVVLRWEEPRARGAQIGRAHD